MLRPSARYCTNTASPSSPYTIDGTPARLAMLISMKLVSLFLGAYSSKYTAAPTPTGTVNSAVQNMIHAVPAMAERTPDCSGNRDVDLVVRKFSVSDGMPSTSTVTSSVASPTMPTSTQTMNSPTNMLPMSLRNSSFGLNCAFCVAISTAPATGAR